MSEDDRREPTQWEYIVGKEPATAGDKAQLSEALEAMRQLSGSAEHEREPRSPAEEAHKALRKAQARADTSQPETRRKDPPLQTRIAKRYRDATKRHLPEARKRLRNGPQPGDEDPSPPESPNPQQT